MTKIHAFSETEGVQNEVQNYRFISTYYITPTTDRRSFVPVFSRCEFVFEKVKCSLYKAIVYLYY